MSTLDWSKKKVYNADTAYAVYTAYREGKANPDMIVDAFIGLAHYIVAVKFNKVYSFDKEDLIAVAIERVLNAINKQQGVFNPESQDTQYRKVYNYTYTVMYNAMKTFLTKFDLTVANNSTWEKTMWDNKVACSSEYLYDVKEMYDYLASKIIGFISKHNRFDLDAKVIKYYTYLTLEGKNPPKTFIKKLFGCENYSATLDNLRFLYKWAMYEVCVEYNFMSFNRCIELLANQEGYVVPVQ